MQDPATTKEAKPSPSKMTHAVRSGKTFLYMTGLIIACLAGYMYGNIGRDIDISYSISSVSIDSSLVHDALKKEAVQDLSRSVQGSSRSLPFGICDDNEDCETVAADDIVVIPSHSEKEEVQKDDQTSRKATIKRICRKYERLTSDEISDDTLKRLFVNEKHRIVYCSIPKASCTNWKRLMMVATNDSIDLESVTKFNAHHNGVLQTLYDYPEYERNTILKSYKKFTFVRNPFIRLLSAYKDKFESLRKYRSNPGGKYFRRYAADIMTKYRLNATLRELESGENVTWSEFILYVTHLAVDEFNEHWKPMYQLCDPCQVEYDFVGRVETINEDANYLLKEVMKLKTSKFPTFSDFATNSSEYTYAAYGDVTLQQLRLLWDIYKWDFWLFGFDKPDFI
ncbi:carbohydrate sulfotransferase 11 [Strongylocentrotus purpuratus]|uniref:Carbohydrate sulfotransferase n=1 Tax=Strongylocentrotus purpuratus TaxID=7668 RepID=A0A7M7N2N1_STRPU|nr:carbohydrate sulfotransferase 11 [Strongylocentrotus purpuratus]